MQTLSAYMELAQTEEVDFGIPSVCLRSTLSYGGEAACEVKVDTSCRPVILSGETRGHCPCTLGQSNAPPFLAESAVITPR
jgi:hypothetical protein